MNSIKEWCKATDISIGLIESRVNDYLQTNNFNTDAKIITSPDLYRELLKNMHMYYGTHNFNSNNVTSFWLVSGNYEIKVIPRYKNFLFIGTSDELKQYEYNGVNPIFLSDYERAAIDREFESIILSS